MAHADTCFSCIVKNQTKAFFRKHSPTPAELSMSWIGHVCRGLCPVYILKEKLNFLLSPSLPNRQFNHAFSFPIIFQKTTKIVSFSLFVPAWSLRLFWIGQTWTLLWAVTSPKSRRKVPFLELRPWTTGQERTPWDQASFVPVLGVS